MWIWILSITVLGSNPEHVKIPKFETKQDCQKALILKKDEYQSKGKDIVGHCYFGNTEIKGWW